MTVSGGGEDDQYTLHVRLKNSLSGEAEVVAVSLERIEEASEDAATAQRRLESQTKDTSGELKQAAVSGKMGAEGVEEYGDEAAKAAVKSKMLERQAKKTNRALKESKTGFLGFIKFGFDFNKVFSAYKIFVIADAIQFLATGINALGAAAVAAINGLAPLSGMLAVYPGALAAGVQGMVAYKIGLHGIGDALKAIMDPNADPEKVAAALKELTPEGIATVRAIKSLRGEWKGLTRDVQSALLDNVGGYIRDLGGRYIPVLNKGLSLTASNLNDVVGYTHEWLDTRRAQQTLFGIMKSNAAVVGNFGRGGSDMFRLFMEFLYAARPLMRAVSADFATFMKNAADFTGDNRSNLSDWLMGSYDLWQKTWDVLKDFGAGLFNIFRNSAPLSRAMGNDMVRIGKAFREWTESDEGQRKTRQFFRDLIPVVRELGSWIKDIGTQWFRLTTGDEGNFLETSRILRTELMPALVEFANTTAGEFIPKLAKLITLWVQSPTFPTQALSSFLDILTKISEAIIGFTSELPPSWQKFISNMFALGLIMKMSPGALVGRVFGAGAGKLATGGALGALGRAGKPVPVMVMNPGFGAPGGAGGIVGSAGKGGAAAGGRFSRVKGALGRGAGVGGALAGTAALMWGATTDNRAMGNIATGAGLGSFAGPWGAAAGAGIGAVVSGIQAQLNEGKMMDNIKKTFDTGKVADMKKALSVLNEEMKKYDGMTEQLKMSSAEYRQKLELQEGLIERIDNAAARATARAAARQSMMRRLNGEYADDIAKLPKEVITQLKTPGVIDSIEYIEVLRDQYDLTPKEVKTLIATSGIIKTYKDIDKLQEEYKLTGKDVVTMITTNGLPLTIDRIHQLQREYDLTRKDVMTLIKANADQAWAELQRIDTAYSGLSRKAYYITLETRGSGAGFRGSPADVLNYKGGSYNKMTEGIVGEFGPEAHITPSGAITLLGRHGPEWRRWGPGAILPASATADPSSGDTGDAPSWAVGVLRRAQQDAAGTMYRPDAQRGAEGQGTHNEFKFSAKIYATSDVDVENAVERGFRKMQREAEERK